MHKAKGQISEGEVGELKNHLYDSVAKMKERPDLYGHKE
jgi:hypothetical protein